MIQRRKLIMTGMKKKRAREEIAEALSTDGEFKRFNIIFLV